MQKYSVHSCSDSRLRRSQQQSQFNHPSEEIGNVEKLIMIDNGVYYTVFMITSRYYAMVKCTTSYDIKTMDFHFTFH